MIMRKIVVFISVTCCCMSVFAQTTKEYNNFIHSIDSLKVKYSVKRFLYADDFSYSFQSDYGNKLLKLPIEEQKNIIDFVCELYDQKEYLGLYGLAGELLNGFYFFSNEEIIKTKIIEIWYDKICYMSSNVVPIGDSKYYSKHSKDRLLEIIEKQWRKEDIAAWTIFIKQTLSMESYKRDVQKIMKENNQQGQEEEKYLLDSLVQHGIVKNLQQNKNRPISIGCIPMIGSLKDERFIPALESMMEEYKSDKDSASIKEACTYALAKLGVQKYLEDVYNSNYIPYKYLGTKEAFLKSLDKNYVWNKGSRMFTNQPLLPSALIALDEAILYGYLKNVPTEIKQELWSINFIIPERYKDYDPSKDEQNKENIQKADSVYNWIKDNSDKWELPSAQDSF